MRAIVLAAGRGERMGTLTERRPKPLLEVGGVTLIEHTIQRLVTAGVTDIVVNHAYLGEQIVRHIGDGQRLGASIAYSAEPDGALETGGGILQALPLLGPEPFIAANADVYSDFDFSLLTRHPRHLAHIVLVPNPAHHPDGDFALVADGEVTRANYIGSPRHTFAGIGVYDPELWAGFKHGRFRLPPVLRQAMDNNNVTGELFEGEWWDVGTPERLEALRQQVG